MPWIDDGRHVAVCESARDAVCIRRARWQQPFQFVDDLNMPPETRRPFISLMTVTDAMDEVDSAIEQYLAIQGLGRHRCQRLATLACATTAGMLQFSVTMQSTVGNLGTVWLQGCCRRWELLYMCPIVSRGNARPRAASLRA
jgi:hypothetical protein